MKEWQELAQSVFIALIFAYLVSKLLSIVLQFRGENFKLVREQNTSPEEPTDSVELDEEFVDASDFVSGLGSDGRVISDEDRLELLGLYMIATEGPCNTLQPSETETSKWEEWNAWSRLGTMSPEQAMRTYVSMVTELYPSWATGSTSKNKGRDDTGTISDAN